MGRPPVMPRRTARRQPMSVKALAQSLPPQAFHTISWREGTNEPLSGRFAALRVRHAGGNAGKARLRPEQWLLIEWPADEAEPTKYCPVHAARRHADSTIWSAPPISAGASSATTRI